MDIGGEGICIGGPHNDEQLNISDVFEAITLADPSFGVGAGAGAVDESMARRDQPYVEIVEQPASKALRFRYECEGRSAGSIPGVNSTSDNKTYPTIKICNYTGQVVIVVSCVTKDEPYKAHPHNLVGRERCERGVCTIPLRVTEETCEYQFKNLGIQCVKRRDIADALTVREKLRVDPFRKNFDHKNHPQSIDLNAVRLCFQVFLPDESGRLRRPLTPVVSDVIYDKKAMSDLLIMRSSHCSGTARGGTQVILLCEKVTREDIEVVFYQEENGVVVWEEMAIRILVHKQVAIAFETPPYKFPHTTEHVNVHFQLKRLSDNARSNSLPFEYIPEYTGTARKALPDLSLFSLLLDKRTDTNNNKQDKTELVSSTTDSVSVNVSDETESATVTDVNGNLEVTDTEVIDTNEKSLNELLDQVAELDEIYSENRTRLENISTSLANDNEEIEDFNDAGTYTSLQLAFKNPVEIAEPDPMSYEDVQVQTYRGPIIEFSPLKRDTDDDRAPPLPPKRVRKAASTEPFKSSQTSVDSILKPGRQIPVTRNLDNLKINSEMTVAKSEPALPPVKKRSFFYRLFRRKEKSPAPSVKSEGRKEAKSKPVGRSVSSISGMRPSKFKSSVSHTSLKDNASGTGLSYADSITHISLHGDDNEKTASQSSLRRPASLAPLPPTDGGTILVAESVLALDASQFKKLQDDLDLTDAEHYALYMAVAPHATVSEFDETSCYYSPVDGNNMSSKRRKVVSDLLRNYELERIYSPEIKSEPRDRTPPHNISSPPLHAYAPQHYDQNWNLENMPAGMQGPSHMNPPAVTVGHNPFTQDIYYGQQPYGQVSPGHLQAAPMGQNLQTLQAMSPGMQAVSPGMQAVSPGMQAMSPGMQPMSPGMQPLSPNMAAPYAAERMSPNMSVLSPHGTHATSPGMAVPPMGRVSPNMPQNLGHISPNMMQHQQPTYVQQQQAQAVAQAQAAAQAQAVAQAQAQAAQQQQQQNLMETEGNSAASFSNLLLDRGEHSLLLNSSELSGLSALLGDH